MQLLLSIPASVKERDRTQQSGMWIFLRVNVENNARFCCVMVVKVAGNAGMIRPLV